MMEIFINEVVKKDENERQIMRGLSFWIVKITNIEDQDRKGVSEGSQEWKGAAASLMRRDKENNKIKFGKIILSNKKIEARVCVRKYLIAASLVEILDDERRSGIKAKVFNSKPIHLKGRDEEEKVRITLIAIEK